MCSVWIYILLKQNTIGFLLLQVSRSIKRVFDGAIGQYTPFHGKLEEPTVTRKVGFALTIMLSDHADTLSVSVSGC